MTRRPSSVLQSITKLHPILSMKLNTLLLSLSIIITPLAAISATDGAMVLTSRINEVTVFADRAQVTRVANVKLTADNTQFAFEELPGWIDEGSVRVALVPADAGQILDVQVKRTFVKRASDVEFRKAEDAVQEIADQIGALDDEKAVLEAESKQVDSIRAFSLEKLPKDTAVREIKPGEYNETLKFITGSLREIATARRELEKKRRELQPELKVRQQKLNELRQTAQLEQRTVVVALKGAKAGDALLSLTYMTPGATWEPVHELRAAPGAAAVSFASYAIVMQTTGEDWSDVKLALSTQRSTETMKIPELDALMLGSGRRGSRAAVNQQDSFQAALANYTSQNDLWNGYVNKDVLLQEVVRGNAIALTDNSKRIEQLFNTLRERGTTARFVAVANQTIRREGRAVRVPLGVTKLAAQHRILAAPELSLNAARTVDLTNQSSQPFLPGKVSLFLDGAFLGMTETDFVAPLESFSLYLGVADHIKLSRVLDSKHSELRRGGQRTRMDVSFIVTVENLSEKESTVQLSDRLPMSETDEVKISSVKIRPEARPDSQGLLKWDVQLSPKQTREFHIEYRLEYPTDLVQRAEAVGKAPGAASDSSFFRLGEQIQKLERKF